MLVARGITFVPQRAVAQYNIDLAIGDSIAVEVFGGGWHGYGRHAARFEERTRYLLSHGWHQVVIWINPRRKDGLNIAFDQLMDFVQMLQREPIHAAYTPE